ncbi:MAG: MerR family transcriptional regulator [Actinomycetaceae bacterium]|nr:MerR family transcriptional regulator [Actinomycetaceae bacterium]
MHISVFARLAGTTVRTIRHYHSLGLLPIPPTGSDGWRDYSLESLTLFLRIRNLALAGIPLGRISQLLPGSISGNMNEGGYSAEFAAEIDQALRDIEAKKKQLEAQEGRLKLLRERVNSGAPLEDAIPPVITRIYRDLMRYENTSTMRSMISLDRRLLEVLLNRGSRLSVFLHSWRPRGRDIAQGFRILRRWRKLRATAATGTIPSTRICHLRDDCCDLIMSQKGMDSLIREGGWQLIDVAREEIGRASYDQVTAAIIQGVVDRMATHLRVT